MVVVGLMWKIYSKFSATLVRGIYYHLKMFSVFDFPFASILHHAKWGDLDCTQFLSSLSETHVAFLRVIRHMCFKNLYHLLRMELCACFIDIVRSWLSSLLVHNCVCRMWWQDASSWRRVWKSSHWFLWGVQKLWRIWQPKVHFYDTYLCAIDISWKLL